MNQSDHCDIMGQQESSYRKFDAGRRRLKVKTVNKSEGEADMETRKREDTGHISFQIPSLNWR